MYALVQLISIMTMVTFSLVVVRHGATDANEQGIIQGQSDHQLNESGRQQATLLGRHFRQCQPFSSFTHAYASDLSRAKETAEIILRILQGSDAGLNGKDGQWKGEDDTYIKLICDSRLRERKYGTLEGQTTAVHREKAMKSRVPPAEYTPEGGETLRQLYDRISDFFRDLCQTIVTTSRNLVSSSGSHINAVPRIPSPVCPQQHSPNGNIKMQVSSSKRNRTNTLLVPLPEYLSTDASQTLDVANVTTDGDSVILPDQITSSQVGVQELPAVQRKSSSDTSIEDSETTEESDQPRKRAVRPPSRSDSSPFASSRDSGISAVSDGSLTVDTQPPEAPTADLSDRTPKRTYSACSSPGLSPGPLSPCESSDATGETLLDKTHLPVIPINNWTYLYGNSGRSVGTRKISVQSIASDDGNFPDLDAQVLVVTHGGAIRELFRYFIDELGCLMVGGKGAALRPCPNTGISSFMININMESDITDFTSGNNGKAFQEKNVSVICLGLHSKEHLASSFDGNVGCDLNWFSKRPETPPCDVSDVLVENEDRKASCTSSAISNSRKS